MNELCYVVAEVEERNRVQGLIAQKRLVKTAYLGVVVLGI